MLWLRHANLSFVDGAIQVLDRLHAMAMEIVFGGLGTGLVSMVLVALLAVFITGLSE